MVFRHTEQPNNVLEWPKKIDSQRPITNAERRLYWISYTSITLIYCLQSVPSFYRKTSAKWQGHQEWKALRGHRALGASMAVKVYLENLVHADHPGHRVHREQTALEALMVVTENKVHPDRRVLKEQRAPWDHQEKMVPEGLTVLQGPRVQGELQTLALVFSRLRIQLWQRHPMTCRSLKQ